MFYFLVIKKYIYTYVHVYEDIISIPISNIYNTDVNFNIQYREFIRTKTRTGNKDLQYLSYYPGSAPFSCFEENSVSYSF